LPGLQEFTFDQLPTRKKVALKAMWERPCNYQDIIKKIREHNLLNIDGFQNEVSIEQMSEFETKNDIGLSVYTYTGNHIYPLRLPPAHVTFSRYVELMLLKETKTDNDGNNVEWNHYTCVPDFRRLIGGKTGYHKTDVCRYGFCLIRVKYFLICNFKF
jgi:hypothetical protein